MAIVLLGDDIHNSPGRHLGAAVRDEDEDHEDDDDDEDQSPSDICFHFSYLLQRFHLFFLLVNAFCFVKRSRSFCFDDSGYSDNDNKKNSKYDPLEEKKIDVSGRGKLASDWR
jgi:hypothetical protein